MSKRKQVNRGGRPSKRDFILERAEELVQEKGAAHLTFDALTLATGISKGGLLYHFESKDALIGAMLERYADQRQQFRRELMAMDAPSADDEICALIRSELAHSKRGKLGVDSAILAAAATNPCLMVLIADRQQELFNLFDQSNAGPIQARVAWYAVLGHRLCRQFGIAEMEEGNDEAFSQYLVDMVAAKKPN